MLGLRGTYKSVMGANGPAQMLTYSFWGVLMAGMFAGMMIEDYLLITWGAISLLITPITIWGSKELLKYALLSDMVLSCIIFVSFLMHQEPEVTTHQFKYYTMALEGMTEATRDEQQHQMVADWFHIAALIWMTFHSAYLANLTDRQILEKKRFEKWN